jgi:hypothetical protein
MSGWDAYIAALLGDKSVMTGAAIYGQGQQLKQQQQRGASKHSSGIRSPTHVTDADVQRSKHSAAHRFVSTSCAIGVEARERAEAELTARWSVCNL